jgi:hypothetical protein
MPRAKELFPLAILGTRATRSSAQGIEKKWKISFMSPTATISPNSQLLQCHWSQTLHTDFHCSQNTSVVRISFTPASEARPSNVPFSPHGTHSCVSTPTLHKIPEERRPSTLTNNSWLMALRGNIAIQSVLTVR